MSFPILTTKLHIPQAHGPLVPRGRLAEILSAAVENAARLVLITAPAGFGKSTLVAAWAESQNLSMAWLSLEKEDNLPERFLAYLIAAIQRVRPGFADDLFGQLQTDTTVEAQALLPALVNAFGELSAPLLVTLDDYHTIHNPAIHDCITFLLHHLPPGVTFLLATRVAPPLALARLRAQRQLAEIRLQELRFTTAEIDQLVNGLYDIGLEALHIAALEERTEGWAAGLQLVLLALQAERDNPGEFIQRFSGSHEYVADYLMEEVLSRQPEALTTFLMRISILDRFCAPLCHALTGDGESEAILLDLSSRNAFLIPLDAERNWFRFHHLLADLLQARLKRSHASLLPDLHHKACAWFESQGYIQEAMDHGLAGRDFQTVERLVNEHWATMLHQRHITITLNWLRILPRMATQPNLMPQIVQTTLDWLATLPESVYTTFPSLNLAAAWVHLLGGRLDRVEPHLESVEKGPGSEDEKYRGLGVEVEVVRAFLRYAQGDLGATVQQINRIWPDVQHNLPLLRGNLQVLLGHAHHGLNCSELAIAAYREAIPLLWQSGNTIGTASAYAGLIRVYRSQSDFPLAGQTVQEALSLMAENRIDRIPAAGVVYLERALLDFDQDRRSEAAAALDLAVETGGRGGFEEFRRACDELNARLGTVSSAVDQSALIEPLTARELEVLDLLAEGLSNQQMADTLIVSLATVKKHVSSILAKLGVANRTQALARSRQLGLLE